MIATIDSISYGKQVLNVIPCLGTDRTTYTMEVSNPVSVGYTIYVTTNDITLMTSVMISPVLLLFISKQYNENYIKSVSPLRTTCNMCNRKHDLHATTLQLTVTHTHTHTHTQHIHTI